MQDSTVGVSYQLPVSAFLGPGATKLIQADLLSSGSFKVTAVPLSAISQLVPCSSALRQIWPCGVKTFVYSLTCDCAINSLLAASRVGNSIQHALLRVISL